MRHARRAGLSPAYSTTVIPPRVRRSLDANAASVPSARATKLAIVLADAITALVSIGYSEKEATKKAEAAATDVGTDDLEVLVRAAMRA